jgi:hypothetical protein
MKDFDTGMRTRKAKKKISINRVRQLKFSSMSLSFAGSCRPLSSRAKGKKKGREETENIL